MIDELDGIEISDLNYDKVCLNCKWWDMNASMNVVCMQGQGSTAPDDTCPKFLHQNSRDDDYNAKIFKRSKLYFYYNDR